MFLNQTSWQGQSGILIRLSSDRTSFNLKNELDGLGYDTTKALKAIVFVEATATLNTETNTGALAAGSFVSWIVEGGIEGKGGNGGAGQPSHGGWGANAGSSAFSALVFQCDGELDLSSGGHVYAGANGGGGGARYCTHTDEYGTCLIHANGPTGAAGYGNPNGSGSGVRGTWGEGVAVRTNGHSVTIINQTTSTVKGSVS